MKTFSHLLVAKDRPLAKGGLSRRLLPGFFLAFTMMLGEDVVAEFRRRAGALLARVKEPDGGPDWQSFYEDSEVRAVLLEALVAAALHFEALEKRIAWLVNIVNSHLSPPDPVVEGEEATAWQLGEADARRLVKAFLSDAMAAMETEAGRLKITRWWGAEACDRLYELFHRLNASLAG